MIQQLTLAVVGRLGPYTVLTEEAVRGLADRLYDGSQIPFRLPDGRLVLGSLIGEVTVAELTPGQFAVRADVLISDDLAALPAELAAADALTAGDEP